MFGVLGALACGETRVDYGRPPDLRLGAWWPELPEAAIQYPAGPVAVVTSANDDRLSVIDLAQGTPVTAPVPVGVSPIEAEGPYLAVASPDRTRVFVSMANFAPGSGEGPHAAHGSAAANGFLLELRRSDLRQVARVNIKPNPAEVVLDHAGAAAFVAHYNLGQVRRIVGGGVLSPPPDAVDAELAIVGLAPLALRPVAGGYLRTCPGSNGLALSADDRTLFVACDQSDELGVVDLSVDPPRVRKVAVEAACHASSRLVGCMETWGNRQSPGKVGCPCFEPNFVHVAPDGRVWVTGLLSPRILVFDPRTGEMDAASAVDVGGVGGRGAMLADGRFLVPTQAPDQLVVVDWRTARVTDRLALGAACSRPRDVVADADGRRAHVLCEGDRVGPGSLVAVALDSGQAETPAAVGAFPVGILVLAPVAP